MDENRIWAPWRLGYIAGKEVDAESPPEPSRWLEGADRECFMCRAAAIYADTPASRRRNLVVDAGQHSLVLLNRYPYSNGHLLVAPQRHVGDLGDLTGDEHLEIMHSLATFTLALGKQLLAEGFNVGLNLGLAGGAGVPGHLHWHLVPRWRGDHNFMPTLAGTRVIPQSLESLWEALVDESA
ncbi:MAG: HIT domain-containing protein [Pirellulales bacterium]|nr:HIT domain-containing protein [Pirellulales bacterium]